MDRQPAGLRRVAIGGLDRAALRERLAHHGVALNDAARLLFDHPGFTTEAAPRTIDTVDCRVADLGFADGATMPALLRRARERGLVPCPLETGPHLRLQWPEQPEGALGQPATTGRAPPGSLTVVSPPPGDDPAVPRGFYLRRIDGVPWLRGYRSDDEHRWSPEDRLLFQRG